MFCVSVGPESCSRRTGGSLDGRLVVANSNAAFSRLSIVPFDTGPKRLMGHVLGGEKKKIQFAIFERGPSAPVPSIVDEN